MSSEEPSGFQHPSNKEIRAWVRQSGSEISLAQHRISIYAVATGDHMGLPVSRLRLVRLAVLTEGVVAPRPESWHFGALTTREEQIVFLARQFDQIKRGNPKSEPVTDEEARNQLVCDDEEVLRAFLAVEGVIQPMDRG